MEVKLSTNPHLIFYNSVFKISINLVKMYATSEHCIIIYYHPCRIEMSENGILYIV